MFTAANALYEPANRQSKIRRELERFSEILCGKYARVRITGRNAFLKITGVLAFARPDELREIAESPGMFVMRERGDGIIPVFDCRNPYSRNRENSVSERVIMAQMNGFGQALVAGLLFNSVNDILGKSTDSNEEFSF